MRIDQAVINLLKTYFVSKRGTTHIAGDLLPGGTDTYKLGAVTNRWDTVYVRQVVADNITGGGSVDNADKVDGFHASATPAPNILLALDASQTFPDTAYQNAILRDGSRSLTGDLAVGGGVKIDGVDISVHAVDNTHHVSGMAADDHSQYMHISSQRVVSAVHNFNPGVPTPFITLGANAQDRLITGLYANRSVDLDRSVLAGDGLTGGGQLTGGNVTLAVGAGLNIVVDGTSVALDTPGSLTALTTNQVATAHTHAVAASYNPGVSESLLKTSSAGELFISGDFGVDADTLYVDVSEDAIYINAGTLPGRRGALTVHPGNVNQRGFVLEQLSGQVSNLFTIFDSSGSDLLLITNAGDLESGNPNFVSGLTGWQITATGDAEFWNATIRGELHASVFVADEMHASGGTLVVMTATKVADPGSSGDNEMAGIDTSFWLRMQASWDTGLCYFADDDIIRIKFMGDDGGGLDVWDVYVQLTSSPGSVQDRDLSNGDPGYFRLTVKRRSGGASGLPIPTGTAGVKWGNRTGIGYSGAVLLTSDLSQSPYIDVFTIDNSVTYDPWEAFAIKPRVRMGNLDGVLQLSEEWGIAFGEDLSDVSRPYAVFSDQRAALHGIEQSWWDLDGNIRGAVDPQASGQDSLFWLGKSGSDKKFEVTGEGLVRLTQAAIGPRSGPIFDGGLLWLPFDGNYWLGGIEIKSEYEMFSPSTETGSIYAGRGKYSSGFASGMSGTNYIYNPNFSYSISTGWGVTGDGTHSRATNLTHVYTGLGSLKIIAGTTYAQRYTASTFSLPNGSSVYAQCRIKVAAGAGANKGRVLIYDLSNTVTRAESYNTIDGDFELVVCSWTNTTGAAVNIRTYVSNVASNSTTVVYFDAVQVNIGFYPLVYCDGDLPGVGWAGTVGNSTSSRTAQKLQYSVTTPTNWTVSCWYSPTATAVDTNASKRIWEWYGSGSDRLLLFQNWSAGSYRLYVQVNGSLWYADTAGDYSRGVSHHFIVTYDGTTVRWYVDNVAQTELTPTGSYGSTPYSFSIGSDVYGGTISEGIISDLFIIDHGISVDDVASIYNSINPVVIVEDFSLRVFNFGGGVISITSSGLFVRDDGNVFGINTSGATMELGGITTSSGDLVIGDNTPDGAAVHWDISEKEVKFYAKADTNPVIKLSDTGFQLVAEGGSYDYNALHAFRFIEPDGTEIAKLWGYQVNFNRRFVISMPEIEGVDADLFIGATGTQGSDTIRIKFMAYLHNTIGGSSEINYMYHTPQGLQMDEGLVVGVPPSFTHASGQIIYTGLLKPVRSNTTYTAYTYVPLTNMIHGVNHWNSLRSGTFGQYYTVSSEWPGVPSDAVAIALRMHVRDTALHPQTGLYFQLGPANATDQNDHLTLHPMGSDVWAAAQGIVKVTNGTVYIKGGASGTNTMDVYLGCVGYFL